MMAGLLVVAGSTAAVVAMKEQRETFWEPRTETTSDLSEINAAIIAYQRSKNHRLPCPASLSSGSGVEDCAASPPAGTTDVGTGGAVRIGALPTRTLGLPDSAGEDKWGNKLTYAVVKTHTDVFQFSNPVAAGAGINVTTATSGSTISNQAYIVVSHGKDGKGATPAKAVSVGIACTSTSGQDQNNCTNDQNFSALGMNIEPGANYFDDIVIFGTPDPVAQQTNRSCKNGLPTNWSGGGVIAGSGSCSGAALNVAVGGLIDGASTASAITNIAAGTTGSAMLKCTDGTLSATSGECYRHCASSTQTWLTNCINNSVPAINHGNFINPIYNTALGYSGTVQINCTDGVLSQQSATCNIVVIGACNNSVAWGCSAGTAINGVDAGCGGTRTWQCQGTNGGATANCSQYTGACLVDKIFYLGADSCSGGYCSCHSATWVHSHHQMQNYCAWRGCGGYISSTPQTAWRHQWQCHGLYGNGCYSNAAPGNLWCDSVTCSQCPP
jgi:hypothetical protein